MTPQDQPRAGEAELREASYCSFVEAAEKGEIDSGLRDAFNQGWNARAALSASTAQAGIEPTPEDAAKRIVDEICARHSAETQAAVRMLLSAHPRGDGGAWRPISEAPRDGTRILAWFRRNDVPRETLGSAVVCRWVDGVPPTGQPISSTRLRLYASHGGYWSSHFRGQQPLKGRPLGWMPLPAPPTPEETPDAT